MEALQKFNINHRFIDGSIFTMNGSSYTLESLWELTSLYNRLRIKRIRAKLMKVFETILLIIVSIGGGMLALPIISSSY